MTFGYDPRKPVLHDVSFSIKGGSVVAIVGPTGSGKSTIVNLIARYYDVQRGRVLIDGVDVRDLTLTSLRTQVAPVFQETYLFSDTVSGNIAYGRPNISEGDIEAAARRPAMQNTDFHTNAIRFSLKGTDRGNDFQHFDAALNRKAQPTPRLGSNHKRGANGGERPFYHPRVCSRSFSAMAPTARPFIAPVICSLTSASTLGSS